MFQKRIALAALLCLGVAGCSGGSQRMLKAELREKINSTETYARVPQDKLVAQYGESNVGMSFAGAVAPLPGIGVLLAAGAGGVLGLFDASFNQLRAEEAAALILPLHAELAGFSFDERLRQQLDATLPGVASLKARPVQIVKKDGADVDLFQKSAADAVLFLTTAYSLSEELGAVQIVVHAEMYPRGAALRGALHLRSDKQSLRGGTNSTTAIYTNRFMFEGRLSSASVDKATNVAAWQQDGLLRGTLEHGISELAALIDMDLQAEPVKAARKPGPIKTRPDPPKVIAITETGRRLRLDNGALMSVTSAR